MINTIIDIVRGFVEKDARNSDFSIKLADSYLRRIRGFQNQLVITGIALNSAAVGYLLWPKSDCCPLLRGLTAGLVIFLANLVMAKLYSNEHRTTKLLFARYPELELVMAGDKSWSSSRVLTRVYKFVQSAWMVYISVLAVLLINNSVVR